MPPFWPIVLKKSAMVSTAEKYALEIEIFTSSRGSVLEFRVAARKKGIFISQYAGSLEEPTFSKKSADFYRSRRTHRAGQIQCKKLCKPNANDWSVAMQTGGQVKCSFQDEPRMSITFEMARECADGCPLIFSLREALEGQPS